MDVDLLRAVGVDHDADLVALAVGQRLHAPERISAGDVPPPVPPEKLAPYERPLLAQRLAELLDAVAA